jgi:rod shape-determining protein MreC
VLTSGDGGVFPRGLPVGVVVKGFDGSWRVALDADAAPIDYVQIMLFKDFAQLVDAAALAPKAVPTAVPETQNASILGAATPKPGATATTPTTAPVARASPPTVTVTMSPPPSAAPPKPKPKPRPKPPAAPKTPADSPVETPPY